MIAETRAGRCQALSGTLLFLFGLPLLSLNERAAVTSFIKHSEGLGQVVELAGEPDQPASFYSGRLVHVACRASFRGEESPGVMTDPDTGVSPPPGTFMLRRNVEMMQWVESEVGKAAGSAATTYSYALEWHAEHVSSKMYHDRTKSNPGFPIESTVLTPPGGVILLPHGVGSTLSLSLGGTYLREFLATSRGLIHFPVAIPPELGVDNGVKGDARGGNILGGGGGVRARVSSKRKKLRREDLSLGKDGVLYTGDGTNPGDLRITYDVTDSNAQLSVIGGVVDEIGSLGYFALPSSKKILMIELGTHSASGMVRRSDYENGLRLFSIRVAAFVMLFVGQVLVYSSGFADELIPVGVGICGLSMVGSAIVICILVGFLWLAASWRIGLPVLITAPTCYYVFRQYSAAITGRTQMYTRVPVQADDADDVDFPEQEEEF